MGRSRIDEAVQLLTSMEKVKSKYRRGSVLRAVRHLMAWLAGRTELPTPNAVNTDDDNRPYCDLCFREKNTGPLNKVDGMDLCRRCTTKEKKLGARYALSEEQRKERADMEAARIAPILDKLEEDKEKRQQFRTPESIKRTIQLRERRARSKS